MKKIIKSGELFGDIMDMAGVPTAYDYMADRMKPVLSKLSRSRENYADRYGETYYADGNGIDIRAISDDNGGWVEFGFSVGNSYFKADNVDVIDDCTIVATDQYGNELKVVWD